MVNRSLKESRRAQKMNFREMAKELLKKIHPVYKMVKILEERQSFITDRVLEINVRTTAIEDRLKNIRNSPEGVYDFKISKTDNSLLYRYMYLTRYIHQGDKMLDIEAGYGVMASELIEVSPLREITCLNSVLQYNVIGRAYNHSEMLEYMDGTIYDVQKKYQVASCFNERFSAAVDERYLKRVFDVLDNDGLFVVAVQESYREQLLLYLTNAGFTVEEIRYQNPSQHLWVDKTNTNIIGVVVARK